MKIAEAPEARKDIIPFLLEKVDPAETWLYWTLQGYQTVKGYLDDGFEKLVERLSDIKHGMTDGVRESEAKHRNRFATETHNGKSEPVEALQIPKLGRLVAAVDLTHLSAKDKQLFEKAIGLDQVWRARSALSEFRKISKQDDPIVRYFVMRLAYEFEPDVDDGELERICVQARDLGCSDAMIFFAERNLCRELGYGAVGYDECIAWLKKAIEAGNAEAYVALAQAYVDGKGVPRNKRLAHQLYEKSAVAGCLTGRIALGIDYAFGTNAQKDLVKATMEVSPVLCQLIADLNELTSGDLIAIACCYMFGIGVDCDVRKAIEICDAIKATKGRCATGAYDYQEYASYLHALAIVVASEGKDATENDKRLAVKLLQEVCARAHRATADASWLLGCCYAGGIGVRPDSDKAFSHFKNAARLGSDSGMEQLALMYLQEGERKDTGKARALLEESASHGNASAQCHLGTRYFEGAFGDPDVKKAMEWWQRAAEGNDASAMDNLGTCYRDGEGGIAVDHKKAVEWFRRAVDLGCVESIINLAQAYLSGSGVRVNKKQAEKLLLKAIKLGSASAECLLGTWYHQGYLGVKNDEKAISFWELAADHGDADAMENLADCLMSGEGVEKDLAKAEAWYVRASEAGNASATCALAACYYRGDFGQIDRKKAYEWSLKAAELGYGPAMLNLGIMYQEGEDVKRNVAKALAWFREAAGLGVADAMRELGRHYLSGDGVDEDKSEAEKWFVKAAETGDADAENTLAVLYYNGGFGKPDFAKSLEWIRKAANDGNPSAMINLGSMYGDGDAGLDVDRKQAVKWFRKAAEKGSPGAMIQMGAAYLSGNGVVENRAEAEKWFVKAAETGDAESECSLGTRYAQGAFGEVDFANAFAWWRKAADHGDADAMENLAICFMSGEGVEKDLAKAEAWYVRASEAGNASATCALAACYYRGDFGQIDRKKAYEWSLKAAELGYGLAMLNLGIMYQEGEDVKRDVAKALAWFREAAGLGVADAMQALGRHYLAGDGEDEDRLEAEKWFVKAAETGDADAENALALYYYNGSFGKTDITKAKEWFCKAAKDGNSSGMFNLGLIFMNGADGVKKDVRNGIKYLRDAAEAGNSNAMMRLGEAYMDGEGVTIDEDKAKEWLIKAVEAGNDDAECKLGCWLIEGNLGDKDVNAGLEKLERAASHNCPQAFFLLGLMYGDRGSTNGAVEQDVSRAIGYLKNADVAGVSRATLLLGINSLGMFGSSYESYEDVQKAIESKSWTQDDKERNFRKAKSWFNRVIENYGEDREVVGMALRWLARIARWENNQPMAIKFYRMSIEKGDDKSKAELRDLEGSGPSEVADEMVSPDGRSDAQNDDACRVEMAFVHKVMRYLKRGNGVLSNADEEKLERLAAESGISTIRYEELIENAEREYESKA